MGSSELRFCFKRSATQHCCCRKMWTACLHLQCDRFEPKQHSWQLRLTAKTVKPKKKKKRDAVATKNLITVNYSGLFSHYGICWTFLYFGNIAAGRTCRIYHNITAVQIISGCFFAPVSFSSFVRWKRSADLRGRVGLASQGELA